MNSSTFPSCFFPTTTGDTNNNNHHLPPPLSPPPPPISGKSNLTTSIYQTELGLFSLTWSRTFLGHSLHLHLHHPIDHHHHHHHHHNINSLSPPISLSTQLSLSSVFSFHLQFNSYLFWKKQGSKNLHVTNQESETAVSKMPIKVFWDLSGAKFGSGPEPISGFYVAVFVNREMALLVGDKPCKKNRAGLAKPERRYRVPVLREEHVYGNRVYVTKVRFGNKSRELSIDCNTNSDGSLCFYVEKQRVLKVKKLKWKFRGNERVEVDGVHMNISWNVHSWLFDLGNNNNNNGASAHAVFMFRFETLDNEEEEEDQRDGWCYNSDKNSDIMSRCSSDVVDHEKHGGVVLRPQKSFSGFEFNGNGGISSEWRKIRRSLIKMRTARSSSSSSISISSASSGCSSSVMEWSSMEENQLTSAVGFSLLVYAWRK